MVQLTRRRVLESAAVLGPGLGVTRQTDDSETTLSVTKAGVPDGFAVFLVTADRVTPTDTAEGVRTATAALDWLGPERGADTYRVTGDIETFLVQGPATVRRDGQTVDPATLGTARPRVDPDSLDNTLRVESTGTGFGPFAVTASGGVVPTDSFEGTTDGFTALDWVGPERGVDELRFGGTITRFLSTDDVRVFVDGVEVDPGNLGDGGGGSGDGPGEGELSVTTRTASPVPKTPRFVEFNGSIEGAPAGTTVIVGFEFKDYNNMWRQAETKELTAGGSTAFSITSKMPYIGRDFPYRAFVRRSAESSKLTGQTREVRVPDFIDTVQVETTDVSVSGTSATVAGRVTDFGKATTVTGTIDLSLVDDQGGVSYTTTSGQPKLSVDGRRAYRIEVTDLAPETEYIVRAKVEIPGGYPQTSSTRGNPIQFQTGSGTPSPNFRIDSLETNAPVAPGTQLVVTTSVTNTGDAGGTQEITLGFTRNIGTVDTEVRTVDSRALTLQPGETETFTLTYEVPTVDTDQDIPIYVESEDMGVSYNLATDATQTTTATDTSTETAPRTSVIPSAEPRTDSPGGEPIPSATPVPTENPTPEPETPTLTSEPETPTPVPEPDTPTPDSETPAANTDATDEAELSALVARLLGLR